MKRNDVYCSCETLIYLADYAVLEKVFIRFHKIAIQNYTFHIASGKETIGLPRLKKWCHLCITRPDLAILFSNIFILLDLTQLTDSLFHSFITLCKN